MASNTCRYNSLHEQFNLWGLSGGSSSGGETEVCCGKCPCTGSPWFLVGQEFYSYIVSRSYCRDLEQVNPFFSEHFNSKCWKVVRWSSLCWSKLSLFRQWNVRRPSWGCAACLVAEISQSLWQTLLNKILREACEVWALVFLCVKQSGRRQSVLTGGAGWGSGWGGVVGGRVDISAVVVEGENGVCFCLHFIPFLMVPF